MKKHILGFAIFGFIFASFAVAFAYIYAPPIPRILAVEGNDGFQFISEDVEKTSCFGATKKNISYQIQYTQYDSDNKQFISKMYVTWKGNGEAPKRLLVSTELYNQLNYSEKYSFPMIFEEPFKDGNEALLVVRFKVPEKLTESKQNLYSVFSFSKDYNDGHGSIRKIVTEPQSVLHFHR